MTLKQIVPSVYTVLTGVVNAFLIDHGGLTIIDTGMPGNAAKILRAVQALGKQPGDIRHILLTHCHADHAGSLAALKERTGAAAYMHALDASLIREGKALRSLKPAPGLINYFFWLMLQVFPRKVDPASIEYEPADGEELDLAGGIKAIHIPGHSAGQLAFLWPQHGGVLFVGDAARNVLGLQLSLVYEDVAEGERSLAKIAALEFAVACFGHGRAMIGGAADQFRQKWGAG